MRKPRKPDPFAAGLIRQTGGRSTGSIHGNASQGQPEARDAIGQLVGQLHEAKAMLGQASRLMLNLDETFSELERWEAEAAIQAFLRNKLTPYLTPPATTPRFNVGDPVWSFNGQPRVVTGMRWAQAMRNRDDPKDYEPPWCWFLDTVDPDDPTCKGCGSEDLYRPRGDETEAVSLADLYYAQTKASKETSDDRPA